METINIGKILKDKYTSDRDKWLEWSLIQLVSQRGAEIDLGNLEQNEDGALLHVEVKIEGREVNFTSLIERLRNNYKQAVTSEAKELFNAHFNEVLMTVGDAGEDFRRAVNHSCKKLGYDPEED